jgi:putative Ca2+/H+ antiporter (TMEM165/GDT1 family)
MASLVRQRQIIARQRYSSIGLLAVNCLGALVNVAALAVNPTSVLSWLALALFLVLAAAAVPRVLSAGRLLARFEAQNGVGAGKQQWIR